MPFTSHRTPLLLAACLAAACSSAPDRTTDPLAAPTAPAADRVRRLLGLLLQNGDRAEAFTTYNAFAHRMDAEFEAEPAPETEQLLATARVRRPVTHEPAPAQRSVTPPSADAEAYILYVRGHYLFLRAAHGGHADALHESRALFEAALERDPGFALAHAGLSNFYSVGAVRNVLRPFDVHFARAIEISQRALALDPSLAIPHVHFGVKALYLDADWDAAGREFATAVAAEPRYAEAHRFLGVYLATCGRRTEALAELREAVRLEPLIAIYRNALAAELMAIAAYDEAIVELRRALELDPAYAAVRERLIRCHERTGRFAEAVAERRARGDADVDAFAIAWSTEGEAGYRCVRAAELRRLIETTSARIGTGLPENAADILNPPEVRLALAFAELGEWDGARACQERACARQPARARWFTSQPDLARLFSGAG